MTKQLVFVHGRAQEHKDAAELKASWIDAFRRGLQENGLSLPIAEEAIRFPYYGDTLYDLVEGKPIDDVAEIIVKGVGSAEDERAFMREVIVEIQQQTGVSAAQIANVAGDEVLHKGPLNWEWLQGVLKAIDHFIPGASGASIAIATNDVYQYLTNIGIRDQIETGVRKAMQSDVPSVVVSHSLGTVVAYNLLRREGTQNHWNVPLFVTLGSPLAIKAIKKSLAPNKHPQCATSWFNAMDERDVVALYPLDAEHFPISPAIVNKRDVDNDTENRHGISGYLSDKDVARRIHDALVG